MYASKFHINTLKEAPTEAEIASHQLMTRAGMIRKQAGGIYSYMPIGLRVIRKIENIIREEMDNAGGLEVTMPMVQPAELWMESGRWDKFGPELLRFKDRHNRDFLLQPTSEEVVTDIVRNEIHSWRQLPKNFYQIQTKFRDERRPRFGIMRGREFTMKDAYSFDKDEAGAHQSYQTMYNTYQAIFTRMGLSFRAVAADTGAIGGSLSHEFQVIADTGEDLIVYDPQSDYAANIELAQASCLIPKRLAPQQALQNKATPNKKLCEEVAEFLACPLTSMVKSVALMSETSDEYPTPQLHLMLIRADHEINEVKVGKLEGLKQGFRLASEAEIIEHLGCKPGYIGPINAVKNIRIIADLTVANMSDFICGANQEGFHLTGVNWLRDLPEADLVADIRNVVEGDPTPNGQGTLAIQRGIEVGHVFFLGTRYSEALGATYLDENGKPQVTQMGCYGIGVTRLAGAAIEQNHDAKGIIWPKTIAPFELVICPVGWSKSAEVKAKAEQLYQDLKKHGVDVILDDRDERPGSMFADWELIGVPVRVTVGERSLKEGIVEIQTRRTGHVDKVPPEQAFEQCLTALDQA